MFNPLVYRQNTYITGIFQPAVAKQLLDASERLGISVAGHPNLLDMLGRRRMQLTFVEGLTLMIQVIFGMTAEYVLYFLICHKILKIN